MKRRKKRIVSIKFDDGDERIIPNDIEAVRFFQWYAESLAEEMFLDAQPGSARTVAKSNLDLMKHYGAWRAEEKRQTNRLIASKPRTKKRVTKSVLVKFRDNYRHPTKWGWKRAACGKFKINLKTLNKRMS